MFKKIKMGILAAIETNEDSEKIMMNLCGVEPDFSIGDKKYRLYKNNFSKNKEIKTISFSGVVLKAHENHVLSPFDFSIKKKNLKEVPENVIDFLIRGSGKKIKSNNHKSSISHKDQLKKWRSCKYDLKPGSKKITCAECGELIFINSKRLKKELSVFETLSQNWKCRKCREIDPRKIIRLLDI